MDGMLGELRCGRAMVTSDEKSKRLSLQNDLKLSIQPTSIHLTATTTAIMKDAQNSDNKTKALTAAAISTTTANQCQLLKPARIIGLLRLPLGGSGASSGFCTCLPTLALTLRARAKLQWRCSLNFRDGRSDAG